MNIAAKSEKTHIIFIGRRNSGKSSLVNAFFGQKISDVSDTPGTTKDSVSKAMELQPYGQVVLVDTAGIDDQGDIGEKKLSRTIRSISSADFAVVLLDARESLTNQEVELFFYLDNISLPYIVAVNKIEFGVNPKLLIDLKNLNLIHYEISCKEKVGIDELKKKVVRMLPKDSAPPLIGDLVSRGSIIIFVISNDSKTTGGNLINSQIQLLKEALDENTISMLVKERELKSALFSMNVLPDLIVTDSQSIIKVAAEVPEKVKITTFSILMARHKGDLPMFIRGLKRVDELQDGDKVLIAEACVQHAQNNEVVTIKIPRWLRLHTKKNLVIDYIIGCDFPESLSDYKLIIHCGACMITRKMMQTRLNQARLMDVPVISYGVLISYMYGAVPRALLPFSEAIAEWDIRKN